MKLYFKSIRYIKTGIITVTLILILLISGGFAKKNFEISKNLDIFSTLFKELYINYIDEINPSELIQTGIEAMLSSLDPYTDFISESEIEDYRFMTTGQYGGVGALIQMRNSKKIITEIYEDFPAHKAGLRVGDAIVEIDNKSTEKLSSQEVSELLKGQPGTSIDMIVKRPGESELLEKTLEREIIKVDNIPYYGMLNDNTGYIKLTDFTQNSGRETRQALNDLHENNDMEYMILDLRNNGGGLLNEAVNVTNLFIERNKKVASTEGRIENRNQTHNTLNNPVDLDIPLVVLVNSRSASAAEIVAGAIQDYDRGVVLGERTFGKGLVQNVIPLSYNTKLKVTVAEYIIPSGRSIQAVDYASRDEDGAVQRIPDSLKTQYKTKSGRLVYDGGGIEPDIKMESPSLSNISQALLNNHLIFDFATNFYLENPEIINTQSFQISGEIYNEFLDFISDKDYDYKTNSEKKLKELKEAIEKDEYEKLKENVSELKNQIAEKKSKDIEIFKDEIKRLLLLEIVPRYYYQQGRVEASLSEDKFIYKAKKVLNDKNYYHEILALDYSKEKEEK